MTPLLAALTAKGLDLIGNAVLAKGKEVVEEKLGVKLPADGNLPTELTLQLKQREFDHEEWLIEAGIRKAAQELEAEKVAQGNVTERWKADMLSDSWLSKNIRPAVLAYWTVVISLMAFASKWLQVDPLFTELIKVSYGVILAAYFIGRSVEKYTDMKERGK